MCSSSIKTALKVEYLHSYFLKVNKRRWHITLKFIDDNFFASSVIQEGITLNFRILSTYNRYIGALFILTYLTYSCLHHYCNGDKVIKYFIT